MQVPSSEARKSADQKRELEEFPPLNEGEALGSHLPPPYTPFDQASSSAAHMPQSSQQQQAVQVQTVVVENAPELQHRAAEHLVQPLLQSAPHQGTSVDGALPSSQNEYYHSASFPGYSGARLADREDETLLSRAGVSYIYNAYERLAPHSTRRLVRKYRHRRGCCAKLCGCICFILFLFIILTAVVSVLTYARWWIPSAGEWNCSSLEVLEDAHYGFSAKQPLRIESISGITVSNIHLVQHNSTYVAPALLNAAKRSNEQRSEARVHVVVEASKGVQQNAITISPIVQPGEGQLNSLVIKAAAPSWWWPIPCIKATVYIAVPELAKQPGAIMPFLEIAAGAGSLDALDLGDLAVTNLNAQVHNGAVSLHSFAVRGSLKVSTTNDRIIASNVTASHSIDLASSNDGITIEHLDSPLINVKSSNGALRATSVSPVELRLQTSNDIVNLNNVTAENITVLTSNDAVHGEVVIGQSIDVRTSNDVIDIRVSAKPGTEGMWKEVTARTSNDQALVRLTGIRGAFDIMTSNDKCRVDARDNIKFVHNTKTHKVGSFGGESAGNIIVRTSNDLAVLSFDG